MALTVATNTGALMAQAAASSVNKEMEISMERLSTGKRINGAADDAAGVAIASRLSAEIRGTNQAIRNAMDGQALIDTAEGAHVEIANILQRMREIAVQSANDTNDSNDRANLQLEMDALASEIDRIADVTSWAGQNLLDGATPSTNATLHSDEASFAFHIGSGTSASDILTVNIGAVTAQALALAGTPATTIGSAANISASEVGHTSTYTVGTNEIAIGGVDAALAAGDTFDVVIEGTSVTVTVGQGGTTVDADGVVNAMANAINAAGITGITATADTTNDKVTFVKAGGKDVTSSSAATTTITAIDNALVVLNAQRADLGAASNRLDSTVSNLTNISANLQAGRGRIEDADFAAETTNLAKTQILQQASTAMLAQANAAKQNVLSLLQG
jgi:flagellin